MEKDECFIERLSFIRHLFTSAVKSCDLDHPMFNAAILQLHDGVELILDLGLEYKNISKNEYLRELAKKNGHRRRDDISFLEYWDVFESKGITVSGKDMMNKLNKARVALKHSGIFIDKTSIDVYVKATATFFKENCKSLFDVDFDSFSMLFLVKESEWKELLKEAEVLISETLISESTVSEQKWVEANKKIALAFFLIKNKYFHYCTNMFKQVPDFFAQQHGLDVPSYYKFLEYSPDVKSYGNGGFVTYEYLYRQPNTNLANAKQPEELATPERVKFCFNYVVETAIALQNKYNSNL